MPKEITKYKSSGGVKIYCIPIESFPRHYTNVYLVLSGGVVGLIDIGSGLGESNAKLGEGIEEIRQQFGEKIALKDIDLLLITHGHMDHFGSLSYFRSNCSARVGIHELDAKQVINFEESIMVVARDLRLFLKTVGISEATQSALMDMYTASKDFLASVPLDFYLREEEEPIEGIFRVYHTPGHCPGEVCIQVDDVLFTGDHLLSHITPHQSPEVIVRYNGLGHYLASLGKLKR
jgi:glyoxylase-like metal-dependent hydrolase (beta-lactamase superfamily II)